MDITLPSGTLSATNGITTTHPKYVGRHPRGLRDSRRDRLGDSGRAQRAHHALHAYTGGNLGTLASTPP